MQPYVSSVALPCRFDLLAASSGTTSCLHILCSMMCQFVLLHVCYMHRSPSPTLMLLTCCVILLRTRLKLKPGATDAEVDALLRDQIVLQPVKELMKYQLIESDEDNFR